MRDMDFCMLTTATADGSFHSRPMSNNGEVEFDGDVWFFSAADSRKVAEIRQMNQVHLAYSDPQKFRFVSMAGVASRCDEEGAIVGQGPRSLVSEWPD